MIKGRFPAMGLGGKPTLFLGLSRQNTELLLEGKPIRFDATGFGFAGTIVIAGGETEEDILAEVLKAGLPLVRGFQCPQCQIVSFNPNDIEANYCGRCHTHYPEGAM